MAFVMWFMPVPMIDLWAHVSLPVLACHPGFCQDVKSTTSVVGKMLVFLSLQMQSRW